MRQVSYTLLERAGKPQACRRQYSKSTVNARKRSSGERMNESPILFALEPELSVDEFIDVLRRSTLAERRPVDEVGTVEKMLRGADVICTARVNGLLIGVSRAISDFAFCTYLSDLAVDQDYQRRGIGKELIERTHLAAGLHTTLILLSAPKATTYYPHIGMTKHESCWIIPRG
jgi:GNAT superfamily N-acetyltransferase